MLKGGYQILDFEGKLFSLNVGMVYEGIYDLIEGTTKAILVSGLNVDHSGDGINHTLSNDFYTTFNVDGSKFVSNIIIVGGSEFQIVIQDNDVVTLVTV